MASLMVGVLRDDRLLGTWKLCLRLGVNDENSQDSLLNLSQLMRQYASIVPIKIKNQYNIISLNKVLISIYSMHFNVFGVIWSLPYVARITPKTVKFFPVNISSLSLGLTGNNTPFQLFYCNLRFWPHYVFFILSSTRRFSLLG